MSGPPATAGNDDGPQPRCTWLNEAMGRLTMGLCLEQQSSLLTTGPKLQKKIAQVFERSEGEYI